MQLNMPHIHFFKQLVGVITVLVVSAAILVPGWIAENQGLPWYALAYSMLAGLFFSALPFLIAGFSIISYSKNWKSLRGGKCFPLFFAIMGGFFQWVIIGLIIPSLL